MKAEAEKVDPRVWGAASLPTLVYLPGLHGDWTLIGGFRKALAGRVRFVEATYPRTLTWSLDDYARGVEEALAEQGIGSGWLLAESFGSQVVWPLAASQRFSPQGIILAGGFVRHPMQWGARLGEWFLGNYPHAWLTASLFGYARIARWRFRSDPAVRAALDEFIARRTRLDIQAAIHRLRLVARNDPIALARTTRLPLYGLAGWLDPIVPWFAVRRWLRRNCPTLREFRVLNADHNVLSTAPGKSADLVLEWMRTGKS